MSKVELLAPAGTLEAVYAAVAGGADAIYLGLAQFSARAFAGNLSREQFIEAIQFAHHHDVKIYVTMNTMLYETEWEGVKQQVDFLYEHDVDAIIVQDLGLLSYLRMCYPDLEVHASTQMHVHNQAGIEFLKQQGVKRVVLARETSIEDIRQATKLGLDIEVFVYGAICISYSGQCLISSSMQNRSANRGMCAQYCRMKYTDQDHQPFQDGEYVLSPKDLNILERLPELLDTGVCSLKIEGRMKSKQYVYLVTKTFRQAIDAYYAHRPFYLDQKRQQELELVYHRGFSQGHLFNQDVKQRMSHFRPNHMGILIGKVVKKTKHQVGILLSTALHQEDGIRILNPIEDVGFFVNRLYDHKQYLVQQIEAKQIAYVDCQVDHIQIGQLVYKTTDSQLMKRLEKEMADIAPHIPVSMHYQAKIGLPFQITLKDNLGNQVVVESDQPLQQAKNAAMSHEMIVENLAKTKDFSYVLTQIHGDLESVFIPKSMINQTRRQACEQLRQLRQKRHLYQGKQPETLLSIQPKPMVYDTLIEAHAVLPMMQPNIKVFYGENLLPLVQHDQHHQEAHQYALIQQLGDLHQENQHCYINHTLNCANSYALAFLLSQPGIDGVVISTELNDLLIEAMLYGFYKRYGFEPNAYQFVYGKRNVMVIKDHFSQNRDVKGLNDLNGNFYEIEYNNIVHLVEPQTFENHAICKGRYMIVRDAKVFEEWRNKNEKVF